MNMCSVYLQVIHDFHLIKIMVVKSIRQHLLKTKASYRWHYANLRPRTRAESAARQAALNYHNTVPQETRDGIADLENQARDIRRRTSTEGVDAQFEWIPDPRLTRARENLYSRTIELS